MGNKTKQKKALKHTHQSNRTDSKSMAAKKSSGFDELTHELSLKLQEDPTNLELRLKLAEVYNATGLEQDLPLLLLDPEAGYPSADIIINGKVDRLLGFGYAHQGNLNEAARVVESALKDFPEALDLWFTCCYTKLSLKEYQSSLKAGEKYRQLLIAIQENENLDSQPDEIGLSCHTNHHKSQILNYMGCAAQSLIETDKAQELFKQAIKASKTNPFAYLNLTHLLIQMGEKVKAKAVISDGLKHCSQVPELTMLAKSMQRDYTVSACLMVKDEEELLPGCLESIRSFVDEIIVVDTGSTDRTIEIAESYGAKIFHQPWEGSFSKHRNYTLEKATSDWCLIIDADEQLVTEDIPLLSKVMSDPIAEIISINVINVYGSREKRSVFLPSVRLFKRNLGVHYDGIVHNEIIIPPKTAVIRANVRLKHFGYDLSEEKMKAKFERSKALLEKQLQENPDKAFALFNLGQLLRSGSDETVVDRSEQVIKYAKRAVELTDPEKLADKHIHLMSLDQLAWSHFYLKQHTQATEICKQALKIKPDYIDPLILLGHISLDQGRLDEAEARFHEYMKVLSAYDMTHEKVNLIINNIDGRVVAMYALACISILKGESETARERFEVVLAIDDEYLEANGMLGELYLRVNKPDRAEEHLIKQIELGRQSADSHLWYGEILLQRGRDDLAEKEYLAALNEAPDSGRAITRLLKFYASSNKLDKLAKFITVNQTYLSKNIERAKASAEKIIKHGHHAQAVLIYELLGSTDSEDANICNDLANCYFRMAQYEKAEDTYKAAIELNNPPVVVYRNLGLTLVALGRSEEGLDFLAKYAAIEPEALDIHKLAGELSFSLKLYQAAVGHYEQYLSRSANDATVLCQLSDCYLAMGYKDAARLGYLRVLEIAPSNKSARTHLEAFDRVVEQS